jgi:acetoin:2,6-dichlorophenolindophenol oxidoreductase subunit alpha
VTTPILQRTADSGLTRLSDEDLTMMLLIRHFETRLLELFSEGKLHGTTHTCLGQEYIPVALRGLVSGEDFMFSNHRGHGHYLARFDDPFGLLAEIMGRQGAICNGVGGSQHIFRDRYMSTGVQGESMPVAVGVALHLKRAGRRQLAVAFIGDGTWGEGSVYEAMNMAQLWRVPLLVVVENNGIAQSTPTASQMAGTVANRAAAFGARYERVDGADINAIRAHLAPYIEQVRERMAPLVVEFFTERVGPHSKGDDSRDAQWLAQARESDWYPRYARAFADQFVRLDKRQRDRIAEVARMVEAQPPSNWEP